MLRRAAIATAAVLGVALSSSAQADHEWSPFSFWLMAPADYGARLAVCFSVPLYQHYMQTVHPFANVVNLPGRGVGQSITNIPRHHGDQFTRQGGYYYGMDPWGFYFRPGPNMQATTPGAPVHHSERFNRRGGYYFGMDPWGFYFADPNDPRFRR